MRQLIFVGILLSVSVVLGQSAPLAPIFGEYEIISCIDSSDVKGWARPVCESKVVVIGIFASGQGEGVKFIDTDYPVLMVLCDGTVVNRTIDLGVAGKAANACQPNLQIASEIPVRGQPQYKFITDIEFAPMANDRLAIRVRQKVSPHPIDSDLVTDAEFKLVVKKKH